MICQRKLYPIEIGRCGKYRYKKTSGHDTGVTIYIQKRFLGFLWWIFVKDKDGCPIAYNHLYIAKAFMNGIIKYYDMLHYRYDNFETSVVPMTDELAYEEISKRIERVTGDKPELECAKKAWELDGKQYIHVAQEYASLWFYIFKNNGKKLWMS